MTVVEAGFAGGEGYNRVRRAKEREIAARRRAIDLHGPLLASSPAMATTRLQMRRGDELETPETCWLRRCGARELCESHGPPALARVIGPAT